MTLSFPVPTRSSGRPGTTSLIIVLVMTIFGLHSLVRIDAFSTNPMPLTRSPPKTLWAPASPLQGSPSTISRIPSTRILPAFAESDDDHVNDSAAVLIRDDTIDEAHGGRRYSMSHWKSSSSTTTAKAAMAVATTTTLAAAVLLVHPTASYAIAAAASDPSSTMAAASSARNFLASLSETGFYQAFSLVFLSEIGDKTFFIAGLLAMKTSKLISFLGSMGALFVMTLISVVIGQVFHAVPSGLLGESKIPLDDVAAVLAFAFFGFKTIKEALDMDEEGGSVMDEELAEAEEEVEASDTIKQNTAVARILSIFGLVFAAEFGDRSFLSTIALSAAQNPASVAAGAIAAHAVATGIAVSGGAVVAKYLSEKVIGIIGGSLFIVFAVTTALGIF